MMQTRMDGAGIYKMSKGHLMNVAQTLVNRMRYDLQYQWLVDRNKPIDRIVNDLARGRNHVVFLLKRPLSLSLCIPKCTIASIKKLFLLLTLRAATHALPGF